MMKKVFFSALLISATLLTSTPAISGTWQVRLPANSPFVSCQMDIENDGGHDKGTITVLQGESGRWGSNSPLSYIGGKCTLHIGDSPTFIQSRTCSGTDFTTSASGGIKCNLKLLQLYICPKVSNPNAYSNYQYGFCPE